MGHIVQHATSLYPYSFRMATVVEVSFRVFIPIALKAGPVLMTSSPGTATNGPKDPRVTDGHPAGIRVLQGAWLFSNKSLQPGFISKLEMPSVSNISRFCLIFLSKHNDARLKKKRAIVDLMWPSFDSYN